MWEIYDDLINGIPEDFRVDELVCGSDSSFIRSGNGSGMPLLTKDLIGAPLAEVAACIKSWNFLEASVGLAAINAYYNNSDVARKNGVDFSDAIRVEDRMNDPFITSQNEVKGQKVTVVGHFPHLESLLEPICDLRIIEWDPLEGDYPLPASEYLLPESDYVYLTCTSTLDKTLPRLLELAKNAKKVTMVGPGTPLAPVLFHYGIDVLSGFMIKDNLRAFRIAAGAEKVKIFTAGQKVAFKKEIV